MSGAHSTIRERDEDAGEAGEGPPQPGLVVVFAVDSPRFVPLPLHHGRIVLGRDRLLRDGVDDRNVSRAHLEVTLRGEQWQLRDLGSTNGSAVDGAPLRSGLYAACPRLLRIGRTLLLPCADLRPHLACRLHVREGVVVGPTLARVHERIRRLARVGQSLLLGGGSGVGKEVAARVFHAASGRPRGPFVALNCATIPGELAERLLFGARRGAYSGAVEHAEGLVQAADGGTLFLDEIGELEPRVQAKLLRVLETREVTPLGETRARPVDLRLCAATLRDLRAAVQAGDFREDLYYRVARPSVQVPSLYERPEELPWLVDLCVRTLAGDAPLAVHVGLIEACLLRGWPGNVRELTTEIRCAAVEALAEGRGALELRHLDPAAGGPVAAASRGAPAPLDVDDVLREFAGNVTRAAERLGIPRSTLRRRLARTARGGGDDGDPA